MWIDVPSVQLIDALSLHVEPWDAFMASYSKRHPELVELVDQVATPHTLTPVTPSQTTPTTNIGKHERAEDMEHSVTKKQKLALLMHFHLTLSVLHYHQIG